MTEKTRKIIYKILIVVFSIVFLVSAVVVGHYVVDSIRANQQHSDIQNMHTTGPDKPTTQEPTTQPPATQTPTTQPSATIDPGTEPTEPTVPPTEPTEPPTTVPPVTEPQILEELQELYAKNPDLVGWIKIEGTKINYPVLQSLHERNYYLYKDFYGNYAKEGSLYVREACDVFGPSDNVTIYGHNMANLSMFGQLKYYRTRGYNYYKEHKYIQFDTLYEHHTYEIIAVFITSGTTGVGYPYHLFDDAATEEEFNEFIKAIKGGSPKVTSCYDIDATAEYGDKLLTLSTCCKNVMEDGRFVIVAKRIS